MSARYVLTRGDVRSDTWARVKEHLVDLRDEYRADNDRHQTELDTARLRARIALLTELLELEKRNVSGLRRGDVTTAEQLLGATEDEGASLN